MRLCALTHMRPYSQVAGKADLAPLNEKLNDLLSNANAKEAA
jgi:hypothetical protein